MSPAWSGSTPAPWSRRRFSCTGRSRAWLRKHPPHGRDRAHRAAAPPRSASGGFTPNQYLTAYGYDQLHAAGITGGGERVALIEIDGFRYSDLQNFAACFGLPIPEVRAFTVGLNKPLTPGGESTLDLEVLDTAAPGLRSIDVFEAGAGAADALEALTAPLGTTDKPQVISVSLGLCERELQGAVGKGALLSSEAALEEVQGRARL